MLEPIAYHQGLLQQPQLSRVWSETVGRHEQWSNRAMMYDAEFKTGSHALFNGVIKPSSNLDKLTDAFLFLLR